MEAGRLPVMGRVTIDLIVGDNCVPLIDPGHTKQPAKAASQLRTPLVQMFHRRKLLFSNAGALHETSDTLRNTGMLRLCPSELPELGGEAGHADDDGRSYRPTFGKLCYVEGDCVLRLVLVPTPEPVYDAPSSAQRSPAQRSPVSTAGISGRPTFEYSFHTAFLDKWKNGASA